MRVAQIIDSLKIGGAQKLQVTFAEGARRRNVEWTVIALQELTDTSIPAELKRRGVRVIYFPARKLLNPNRIRQLARFLRNERFDVVQTHLTTANTIGTMAAFLAGVPSIATLHTAGSDPRYQSAVRRALEGFMLRFVAARVLAVGDMVAEAHRKRLKGKKIDVVPNAVASSQRLTEQERFRVRTEITGNPQRPLLIAVGRLSPPKGYHNLLKAFAIVRKDYPDAALAIAGSGMLYNDLQQQIQDLSLQRHAFLLGSRNDIPQLLASSDIFVSSSQWEGLPVSVLEAMAAGLPVVATAVGDVPTVVTPSMGVLVPPGKPELIASAVCLLLADSEQRNRLGEAGRDHVSIKYSLDVWIDQLLSMYAGVISYSATNLLQEAR